jgi:hypothetical protein
MTLPELFADLVMVVHAVFSLFVVAGLIFILTGLLLRWNWTSHRQFRVIHLTASLVVAVRVWLEVPCPFSVVEEQLRAQASASCAVPPPLHDVFKPMAFRGINPQRFARSTTAVGLIALATFTFGTRHPRATRFEVPRTSSG